MSEPRSTGGSSSARDVRSRSPALASRSTTSAGTHEIVVTDPSTRTLPPHRSPPSDVGAAMLPRPTTLRQPAPTASLPALTRPPSLTDLQDPEVSQPADRVRSASENAPQGTFRSSHRARPPKRRLPHRTTRPNADCEQQHGARPNA